MAKLTRRGVFAVAGGSGLAWAVGAGHNVALGGPVVPWTSLATGEDGTASAPAKVRIGGDGVAEIELVATMLAPDHPLRGLVTAGYADGVAGTAPTIPGPTLVLPSGRRTRITLRNDLTMPTSLHLHGLRIAPAVDAPFAMIEPGDARVYDVTVPATQVGTYWYHPHVHGLVEPQMRAGMTGGMVLDREVLPEPVVGSVPALLVLTTLEDESDVLVNGRREPRLTLGGSHARLRLVNTSVGRRLVLRLDDHGHPVPMHQVATDAGWLEHSVPRADLELSPGERAEVIVDLPPHDVVLFALDPDGGDPTPLATVSASQQAPSTLMSGRLAPVRRLLPGPHTHVRRITFGLGPDDTFTIDGKRFDHHRVDVRVRRGSTEVWELVNTTDLEHPFHIHSYPFQVLSRGGKTETLAAWRDVALLRPREHLRIIIPFHGYGGRTVFHCHNVAHEDAGMMATVLVT